MSLKEGIRILVIDDDMRMGRLFKEYLSREGITADFVSKGCEGLSEVARGCYDLVFLDVILPDLNGIRVLEKIRVSDKEIKVVLITGYEAEGLMERAREYGVSAVVHKPIDMSYALDIIYILLGEEEYPLRKRCLLVDRRGLLGRDLYGALALAGFSVTNIGSFRDICNMDKIGSYGLFVLDVNAGSIASPDGTLGFVRLFDKERIVVIAKDKEEGEAIGDILNLAPCRYIERTLKKEFIARKIKDWACEGR